MLSFNPSDLLAHGKVGKWDDNCFDQSRNGAFFLVSLFFVFFMKGGLPISAVVG